MVREGFIIGVSSAVPELTFCFGLVCAGGIVGHSGAGIRIEKSSVVGNTASTLGGGIYVQSYSTLSVTSTTVENNTAGYSGGESTTHFVPYRPEYIFLGLLTERKFWNPDMI
jgi:predicted outer membrane repeat protein